jgi:enamine deaminase RidA (YjgF/YER057c/UK114 family)
MASEDNKPHAFNPDNVPAPPPSYKQVCVTPLFPTSKLITLAGMTGYTPEINDTPDTVTKQAPKAFEKIKNALAAAGATPRDIVQVKHYIVKETGDPEIDKTDVYIRGWADPWMEFMDQEAGGHRPPDTVVGVAALALKGILYECEVWAIIHQ